MVEIFRNNNEIQMNFQDTCFNHTVPFVEVYSISVEGPNYI